MTTELHPNVRRVAAILADSGAAGQIVVLSDAAPTAAAAAAQLGCEVGAIANSLIFDADGAPLLVLTSGAHRADTATLAAAAGVSSVRRASPEFVREHTGQPIAASLRWGIPTDPDADRHPWLAEHEQIWAAAGHPHTVFPTTYDELIQLTGATPVEVAGP